MERARFAMLDRRLGPDAAETTPHAQPSTGSFLARGSKRRTARPSLHPRRDTVDRLHRGQRLARMLTLEPRRPASPKTHGEDRRTELARAQRRREHLARARRSRGASDRLDTSPQGTRIPAPRPESQHRLEAPTGHPEIVNALRMTRVRLADVLSKRPCEALRHVPGDRRDHAGSPTTFLRRSTSVTRSQSSSEMRPSLRVASSVSKPYSRDRPSSSWMMRRW